MATPTADPTGRFFEELAVREHEPLLRKASGSASFDIVDGRKRHRWTLTIDRGDIAVVPGAEPAECVVRVDKKLFDKIVRGRENAVAAVLRGDLQIDGDWRFLVLLQRLFPGPRKIPR
jgi:putative sterol carrier protein